MSSRDTGLSRAADLGNRLRRSPHSHRDVMRFARASSNQKKYKVETSVRVLQVNKLYAPWIGGVEAVVQDIAEALRDLPDFACEVLVCRDRGRMVQDTVNGVRVTRVGSLGRLLSMPMAPGFPSKLRSLAADFDLVHVHVPFPLAMFCDWKKVKASGARLVIHYHSDIVRPLQKRILSYFAGMEREFFEAAGAILVTSEGLMRNSQTLAPYLHKCRVVPLSIDLDGITPPSPEDLLSTRKQYGLSEKEQLVLFAGRLVYYKGLEYLIEAVRGLDVRLLIAGDGPLRPSLESQINNAGLDEKVRILGRVTDTELSALYSMSDVFVLPSTESSEAFGLVQLEAMARGLPVINTNLPTGVPSVSLDGETGITVAPRDVNSLRDAIAAVISNPLLRARFSENARQRVQLFSRSSVIQQIRLTYEELIHSASSE